MSAHTLNTSLLRSRLKLKSLQSESILSAHHPQAVAVLESAGIRPGKIRHHAQKLLLSAATAASIISSPMQSLAANQSNLPDTSRFALVSSLDLHAAMASQLASILPKIVRPLRPDEESQISDLFKKIYGITATPELDNNRLNTDYGLIGLEQHLARFPGDIVPDMAPGRGAWGYFAPSKDQLTEELVLTEKYYVAVQTLYLPDWNTRLAYLRDWYKYRRVVLANPKNGKVIIAAVADSGPAAWTGKHFGGSPEVMEYLHMKDGRQKGPVVLFFLDDPKNQVPLGPVEYNLAKGLPII